MSMTAIQDSAARGHAGRTPGASPMRLGVQIGARRWLIDLAEAGEIVPLPAIVPVPLTHGWLRGLASLRGALHTVVDLAAFAGEAPVAIDKDTRLLALGEQLQFNASLLVSRMLGLRATAGMRGAPEASASEARPAWQGAAWIDDAGAAWHELALHRLVRDERFLQIGRRQAA